MYVGQYPLDNCIEFFVGFIPLVILRISPKLLFTVSMFITALATGVLALFAYLKETEITQDFTWVPLVSVIIIVFMRGIGTLSVMYTLLNELYPTEIRDNA